MLDSSMIYNLCNKYHWFTEGLNSQYEKMFEYVKTGVSYRDIAAMIAVCSSGSGRIDEIAQKIKEGAFNDTLSSYTDKKFMREMTPAQVNVINSLLCDRVGYAVNQMPEIINDSRLSVSWMAIYEDDNKICLECLNIGRLLISYARGQKGIYPNSVSSEMVSKIDGRFINLAKAINTGVDSIIAKLDKPISRIEFNFRTEGTAGVITGMTLEGGYNLLII